MSFTQVQGRNLRLGAILPHTQLFGGVRRFFELGTILQRKGHTFTIFTPEGLEPTWFSYSGKVEKLDTLAHRELDALFLTETGLLNHLVNARSRLKIFYHVGPRPDLRPILKHPSITVFANSSNMVAYDRARYGVEPVKALGGVHIPNVFKTDFDSNPFVVMAYGRLSRKGKGTSLVVKACEKLHKKGYTVKLILFDSPLDENSRRQVENFTCKVPFEFVVDHPVEKNQELFRRADVFVAAEKKGGWSNTAAEALASGVPLVATKTGTRDFLVDGETGLKVWRHPYFIRKAIEKLINNRELARQLSENGRKKISAYSWEGLADFIESYVVERI